MKLNTYTVIRIAVPILILAGYVLYGAFDRPYAYGGPIRLPGALAWTAAALLTLGYHIRNKNRPKLLLSIAAITFIASILSYLYALYGTTGFDGLGWFLFVSVPLAGLSALLFVVSLYVGRPK